MNQSVDMNKICVFSSL